MSTSAPSPATPARDRRPMTTPHFALGELRRLLLTGELAPGQPIRQDALADLLGVSRVPIREALKILEGEGQVEYRPRRGYIVSELSVDDLSEIYRLRRLLETEAARQAVKLITDEEIAALEAAEAEVEAAGAAEDVVAIATANRRFHFIVFEAARMPHLLTLLTRLWDATAAYRSVYYGSDERRRRFEEEHWSIINAVRARDARDLVKLLNVHRDASIDTLRQAIVDLKSRAAKT